MTIVKNKIEFYPNNIDTYVLFSPILNGKNSAEKEGIIND